MPVSRQKRPWRGMNIGEIASSTAGNANFLCSALCMIKNQNGPATLPCNTAAHQAGSAAADNHNITVFIHHTTRTISAMAHPVIGRIPSMAGDAVPAATGPGGPGMMRVCPGQLSTEAGNFMSRAGCCPFDEWRQNQKHGISEEAGLGE